MLYIQRCRSAYHSCIVWFFDFLPVSSNQSGHSPLNSLSFSPTGLLQTGRFFAYAVNANPRRPAVSEILKPPCLAPTIIPRSKIKFTSIKCNHHSAVCSEQKLNLLTMSACLYALHELLPHDWLIKYLHQ